MRFDLCGVTNWIGQADPYYTMVALTGAKFGPPRYSWRLKTACQHSSPFHSQFINANSVPQIPTKAGATYNLLDVSISFETSL
jgi:hypothetical protein